MSVHTQDPADLPTHRIEILKQSYGLTMAAFGGLILFGMALYALTLLQHMAATMEVLPQVKALLVSTNDRLGTLSSQMQEVDTNMKKLPPLLTQVNENVSKISPPLKSMNANVQGTSPALQKMDNRLSVANQRLAGVQKNFGALQKSIDRMEESTHRLRKILPR